MKFFCWQRIWNLSTPRLITQEYAKWFPVTVGTGYWIKNTARRCYMTAGVSDSVQNGVECSYSHNRNDYQKHKNNVSGE
jgi:hypothetical protein